MPLAWIVRLFFLAALVAILGVLVSITIPKGQTKLYVGAPVFLLIVLWMGAEALLERRRISLLTARLGLLGFSPRESSDIHYEPTDRDRNLALAVNMRADWKGVPIRVTEFTFQQGSGKNTVKHRYSQAGADAPDIPPFQLKPAGFLVTQNFSDLKVLPASDDSPAARFSRRWHIVWPHADEAHERFPEPLVEWLMDAPRYESWTCANGELSCSWKRGCTPDQAEQLLGRLATFLRLYRS